MTSKPFNAVKSFKEKLHSKNNLYYVEKTPYGHNITSKRPTTPMHRMFRDR